MVGKVGKGCKMINICGQFKSRSSDEEIDLHETILLNKRGDEIRPSWTET